MNRHETNLIRGISIGFILFVNVEMYFRPLSSYGFQADPDFWDSAFLFLRKVFIQGKFLSMLSFLLGFGIASQYSSRGHDHAFFLKRGLFFLFLGIGHGLIWPGDILTFYGIIVLLSWRLGKASPRMILLIGSLFAIISCLMVTLSKDPSHIIPDPFLAQQYLKSLTLRELLFAKIYMYALQQVGAFSYGWGIVAAFLFGMYTQRMGALANSRVIVSLGLLSTALYGITELCLTKLTIINSIAQTASCLLTPYLYINLTQKIPRCMITISIENIGKCSLSNYLLQSCFLSLFGMSYTVHKLVTIERIYYFWIVIGFFIFQVILTTAWLRKYPKGPLEAVFGLLVKKQR